MNPDHGTSSSPPDPRELAAQVLLHGRAPVAVLDLGEDGPLLQWVNPAFERVTGYTLEEVRRGGLISPGLGSVVQARLHERAGGEEPFTITLPLVRADGHRFSMVAEFTPQAIRGGTRFVVIATGAGGAAESVQPGFEQHSRIALETMAGVSEVLSEEDESEALTGVARVMATHLFAWCGFFAEDGVLQPINGLAGLGPERRARPRRGITASDETDPVGRLLGERTMERIRVDLDAAQVPGSWSAQLVELANEALADVPEATREVVLAPLLGRGRVLGLVAVAESGVRPVYPDAGAVLEIAARRVGLAMDHTLLYEAEHVLAETLQRTMLPELDHIDALDVWTYYSPNAEHAQVGGDWYDVVRIGDGAVAAVVGDVVGHDVEAASAMGQLRSVLRALANELVDPGTVLTRVDSIVEAMRIRRAASMVYTTLTPTAEGAWLLEYTGAGHLPGLVYSGGTVTDLDGAAGTLIGFGHANRETAAREVGPGDVLLLYTDGLIERRARPVQDGLVRLREVFAEIGDAPDAAGVGELLLRSFDDPPEDDIAVVVIRVPTRSGEQERRGRSQRWRLPSAVESVRHARVLAAQTCREWGRSETAAIELVVSELVANAVVHGWGSLEVRVHETVDGVRVEVEDGNPMPPTHLDAHPARVGGYGMHIVDRLADWGWRPSGPGKVVWARLHGDATLAISTGDGARS
ncbi:ATP-binding SpoIIE family protein phosphatase [Ruania halotolerans]|uniref:ATP-binding SpoIIE family protein phosphatase n=1 Tax=Ruania halotolerans TaxID=2897773 RepID=UPI001E326075|nr:SpoIIE family protein phosphatase [Ruania halotolerans]UFU06046.1 SpoIIE family protein phosphatase [Ruania halotolerans]